MDIRVQKGQIEEVQSDMLVIAFFEGQKSFTGALQDVNKTVNGYIDQVLQEEGFEGKAGESVLIHTHMQLPVNRVLVIGMGPKKDVSSESLRRMAAVGMRSARVAQVDTLSVSLDGLTNASVDISSAAQAMTEGFMLGGYQFIKYKGKEREKAEKQVVHNVIFVESDATHIRHIQKAIDTGMLYSNATIVVRDLVNEPAVHMKPKTLAAAAEKIGKIPGVTVQIYKEAAIKKLKMGSFLSVAAGSDEEPYLIHLSYKPKKKNVKKVAFCGKGITFDSGGLSLKPADYMLTMKEDMAGAAIILGVFSQIVELKPNVEVHGVIAATENMISGSATRPGDVVTAYNGTTIEIMNTDAEGRLILADALSWAEDTIQPDYMIDFATLTGSAIIALGQEFAALFGTDKKLTAQYMQASKIVGEPTWELPLVDEYRQFMRSSVADISNISTVRWGGTITAALFLQSFVEKTPWLHIDIAGPAFVEKQVLPYSPYGGSGFAVRTTLQFLRDLK